MKWEKMRTMAQLTVIIVVTAAVNIFAAGNVEWNILKTLNS
jgi:uncharacterized membrane protein YuzA (DUF378 family)